MRIALIVWSLGASIAWGQPSPDRIQTRIVAREICDEIHERHPHLRRAEVHSSSFNPETGRFPEVGEISVPCVLLRYDRPELGEALIETFGNERAGVPITYRQGSVEPGRTFGTNENAFSEDVPTESAGQRMARASGEVASRVLDIEGVTGVGLSTQGLAKGVIVTVSSAAAEREVLAIYPSGAKVADVPIVVERGDRFDARDPVADGTCAASLERGKWSRVKRQVRRLLRIPLR